jgi:site-specific DNA recombinase
VICNNRSVNGQIEQVVWADICSLLQDPGRLRDEFERRLEQPSHESPEQRHREQVVAQLKQRICRLIDAYESGFLDKAEFQPRIAAAKERLKREEAALLEQQRQHVQQHELRLVLNHFEQFAQQIANGLDDADFATRRKLLRLLVHRIEVAEDEVRLVYKVTPRPFAHSPARGVLHDCVKFRVTPSAWRNLALRDP